MTSKSYVTSVHSVRILASVAASLRGLPHTCPGQRLTIRAVITVRSPHCQRWRLLWRLQDICAKTDAQSRSSYSSTFTEQIDVKRNAKSTLTFSHGLEQEKREVGKNVQNLICMGRHSNRKASILCAVIATSTKIIITNTGTSLGCFQQVKAGSNKANAEKLKSISWEQAWDTVNPRRSISYLQICLMPFKMKSDATRAEGGWEFRSI